MCYKLRVEINKTLAKYCTKEYERLTGANLQSIVKLSVYAKHLVTKGRSVVIVKHPLLLSTQCKLRARVSSVDTKWLYLYFFNEVKPANCW